MGGLALALVCLAVFVWFVLLPRPNKPTGTLLLEIEPADSQAEIDGTSVDAPETQVPPGEHRVTVWKGGYEPFAAVLKVNENDRKAVKVRLVPEFPGGWVSLFNGKDLSAGRRSNLAKIGGLLMAAWQDTDLGFGSLASGETTPTFASASRPRSLTRGLGARGFG